MTQNLSDPVIRTQEKPPSFGESADLPSSATAGPGRDQPERPRNLDAENALCRLGLRHLDRILALKVKVLKGRDAEAVHDFRVASRRLEAVLELLFPAPLPADVKRLRRPIRRCRKMLSEARDMNALADHLHAILARKRVARRQAWTVIVRYFRGRRRKAFQQAQRKIGKADFERAHARLRARLSPAAFHARSFSEPPILPAGWDSRMRGVMAHAGRILEDRIARARESPETRTVHAARIAAKRARYLAEVLHALGMPTSAEMTARLRELQKLLGNWHDLELLENAMIEVLARPKFIRNHLDTGLEIGKLIAENRRKKKKVLAAFQKLAPEILNAIHEWPAQGTPLGPEPLVKT